MKLVALTGRRLRLVSWNLGLAFALLAGVEIALRFIDSTFHMYRRLRPGEGQVRPAPWAAVDPELGWTVARDGSFDVVHYRINREGFRNSEDFRLPAPGSTLPRVMFIGDSFTFGVHVQEAETLPARWNQRLASQYEVFNLGVPGYGIDQMVLSYKLYQSTIRPSIVVLVFIDEDIPRVFEAYRRTEGLPKPAFELQRGELVRRQPSEWNLGDRLLGRSRILNLLYSRWYRPRESLAISGAFLRDLGDEAVQAGQRLAVVRFPSYEQLVGTQRHGELGFRAILEARSALYLEPFEELRKLPRTAVERLYFPKDRHPSAQGYAAVADLLAARWPS